MPKDETYYFHQTPFALAKQLIDLTPLIEGDVVLEPFKGEGAFYNHLPDFVKKEWTEIEEGKDYKSFTGEVDWVISNPPFKLETTKGRVSSFWTILKHYTSIAKKGICFLGNDYCFCTLTPKRMKELNDEGWYLNGYIICNIKAWRGRYFYMTFTKEKTNHISFLNGSF